ncbi:hypothetical protein KAR10_03015 [bacterium]|nr:hypothetical protein [bacterium]
MLDILYRASFFLYEIGFMLLAVALWIYSRSMRKLNQTLRQPVFWIWPAIGALLLAICASNHFFVYYWLSPQYLRSESRHLLILMYVFKTVSMGNILIAGLALAVSNLLYLRRISK